jgi:signal transduction histidine kinase
MNKASSQHRPEVAAAIDDRMIATMRATLAASALLIIYFDPSEPNRFVSLTYGALVAYTLYSVILLILAFRRQQDGGPIHAWSHWVDIGCYAVLISLSSGTSSIFFFFFYFSILVASFRWGFASGFRVTIVSAALFSLIGGLTAPSGPYFELNRSLLRPICLLVLGYMIAHWGGAEIVLKRRLALLREIALHSNSRLGVDRMIGLMLEQLRDFYAADACVLILLHPETGEYSLRRAERQKAEAGENAEPIHAEGARQLLALPAEAVAIFSAPSRWWLGRPTCHLFDVASGEPLSAGRDLCQPLANLLDADSLVTIPLYYQSRMVGRVFLVSRRPYAFNRSTADFLIHVYEQILPVVDNIRLTNQLAAEAAEHERQRIARDLHDSVIQPYIGLQIGLSAINQKLDRGVADVSGDVKRLLELTHASLSEMRHYVRGLKGINEHEGSLLPSVQRFAAKFADATGITVRVEAEGDMILSDRLAAEAFQMVAEGLSNIRRHTHAGEAFVGLSCAGRTFVLRIENDAADEGKLLHFTPRSIAERAAALGGEVRVEQQYGITCVIIHIPLHKDSLTFLPVQ